MGPTAGQTGEEIFQLGQLDLELAFFASCPLGEYIEDQLASINDSEIKGRFEIALLCRAEILVENDYVRFHLPNGPLDLFNLSAADQGGGAEAFQTLGKCPHYLGPRGQDQLFQLVQAGFQRD